MGINFTVQFISADSSIPTENELLGWAGAALDRGVGEITIRITDEDEMRALNKRWLNIDKPTNVLSFPLNDTGDSPAGLVGDIVICAPVIRQEAAAQGKSPDAHWAHIIIHGILHLMGYDHINDMEAETMEAKETAILSDLGFPDPYSTEIPSARQAVRNPG